MALVDEVNKVLRDFVSWSDSYPLPIGDHRSGVHHIAKADLRDLLILILQTLGDEDALQELLTERPTFSDVSEIVSNLSASLNDFWTPGRPYAAGIVDENGTLLLPFSSTGRPVIAPEADFWTPATDGMEYGFTDENGVIFFAADATGANVIGGGSGVDPSIVGRVDAVEGELAVLSDDVAALSGVTGYEIYDDTAAGLAATPDGGVFAVGGSGSFLTLYRKTAGTAVEVSRSVSLTDLPERSKDVAEEGFWKRGGLVHVQRGYGPLYTLRTADIAGTHAAIYNRYNALMAAYPDYITRSTLGQDGLANPIYAYRFAPAALVQGAGVTAGQIAHPQIVLAGGTHGHEIYARIAALTLMDDIANRWQADPILDALRWGCEIIAIPCINPSGIDLGTRKNANGVDLNRNQPQGWESAPSDPTSNQYRGPSPLSEPESVVVASLPSLYPDASFWIDYHTHDTIAAGAKALWIGATSPETVAFARPVLNWSTGYLRREFDYTGPQGNTPISQVSGADALPGAIYDAWRISGARSVLVETPNGGMGSDFDLRRFSAECIKQVVHAALELELDRRRAAYL